MKTDWVTILLTAIGFFWVATVIQSWYQTPLSLTIYLTVIVILLSVILLMYAFVKLKEMKNKQE